MKILYAEATTALTGKKKKKGLTYSARPYSQMKSLSNTTTGIFIALCLVQRMFDLLQQVISIISTKKKDESSLPFTHTHTQQKITGALSASNILMQMIKKTEKHFLLYSNPRLSQWGDVVVEEFGLSGTSDFFISRFTGKQHAILATAEQTR